MPPFDAAYAAWPTLDALDVAPFERGEPEAAVVVGVGVRPDPEVPEVQQAYGGRGGALQRHPVQRDVLQDGGPCLGELAADLEDPVELRRVALDAPLGVVEVLLAACRVDAHRLDVAVGHRADPDVLPGRWDHQALDPGDVLGSQLGARLVEVGEALPDAPPRPSLRTG